MTTKLTCLVKNVQFCEIILNFKYRLTLINTDKSTLDSIGDDIGVAASLHATFAIFFCVKQ